MMAENEEIEEKKKAVELLYNIEIMSYCSNCQTKWAGFIIECEQCNADIEEHYIELEDAKEELSRLKQEQIKCQSYEQGLKELNQVLCRECKKPMKQYPQGILAFGCKECKVKATISYEKMPVIKSPFLFGTKNPSVQKKQEKEGGKD